MPDGVTMWVEYASDGDVVYIDAEEITERGAQMLQTAFDLGVMQVHDLLSAYVR